MILQAIIYFKLDAVLSSFSLSYWLKLERKAKRGDAPFLIIALCTRFHSVAAAPSPLACCSVKKKKAPSLSRGNKSLKLSVRVFLFFAVNQLHKALMFCFSSAQSSHHQKTEEAQVEFSRLRASPFYTGWFLKMFLGCLPQWSPCSES